MNFKIAITKVLEEVGLENSVGTQKAYLSHSRKVLNYWGGQRELSTVTRLDVQAWANKRRQECSPATVRHELAFLSRIFRTALDHGWVMVSPTVRIRLPKINNQRTRTLSRAEEAALEKVLGPETFSIVLFALHTGLRRLELFSLRPSDVQLWEDSGNLVGMAHIRTSKTGKGRKVPLNPVAAHIVKAWLGVAQEWIFGPQRADRYDVGQRFSRDLRKACVSLGIKDLKAHDLRHSCATRSLVSGARLEQVQHLLGHANITQTQRYVHVTEEYVWPAVMALLKAG